MPRPKYPYKTVTIGELREAFRQVFPVIKNDELDNLMLILQARIWMNRADDASIS